MKGVVVVHVDDQAFEGCACVSVETELIHGWFGNPRAEREGGMCEEGFEKELVYVLSCGARGELHGAMLVI